MLELKTQTWQTKPNSIRFFAKKTQTLTKRRYLDLKFNIQTADRIEPWLNLLPLLKSIELHIENDDWKNNLTKDNTIQLHILNRSFTHIIEIKKTMYWIYFSIR